MPGFGRLTLGFCMCCGFGVLCRILMAALGSSVKVRDRGWPEHRRECWWEIPFLWSMHLLRALGADHAWVSVLHLQGSLPELEVQLHSYFFSLIVMWILRIFLSSIWNNSRPYVQNPKFTGNSYNEIISVPLSRTELIQALSSLFLAISYNWNKNHGKYPLAYRKVNL